MKVVGEVVNERETTDQRGRTWENGCMSANLQLAFWISVYNKYCEVNGRLARGGLYKM